MTAVQRRSPRGELAEFLRSRRARVRPADVGLPESARRRTPGLRREEVAQLADVGASWYTWLEQGRDIHVSEPLLERLARVLRLTPAERAHLFVLAQGRPPARPATATTRVSDALQRTLDAHVFPAVASTPRGDLLAWNRPAAVLYGDLVRAPVERRNGLWMMFTDAERRATMPDWDARSAVARFRRDAARAADRSAFDALAAELSAVSPEFARLWGEHEIGEISEGAKRVIDPRVGVITLDHVTLSHLDPDGHEIRVTLYTPRPGESTARAWRLFGPLTP